jgi:hypothetical protein
MATLEFEFEGGLQVDNVRWEEAAEPFREMAFAASLPGSADVSRKRP